MKKSEIDSVAFQKELLRSEKQRIVGVIIYVAIFAIAMDVRIVENGSSMSSWGSLAALALVVYEAAIFLMVQRSLRAGTDIPVATWLSTILIETAFPAIGIALFSSPQLDPLYRPLATPWVLAFFPFIILSILRLNPLVCCLAGLTAALTYLAAAFIQGWRPVSHFPDLPAVTDTAVAFFALMFVVSGLAAAAVAAQTRKHVRAALQESNIREQLKEVEHELTIASSIQRSLMPRTHPVLQGFEIAGWNHPADETGGDFFDWQNLDDGRLVVTLADVTGHGIGPAMLASVCRAYARASFNTRDSLATIMDNINRSFGEDVTHGRFATFVAAVCTAALDRVEILSAGHAPLFVYRAETRSVEKFEAQSVPLGIESRLDADSPLFFDLRPGDLVLLITDGFFEWANAAGEQFGPERLSIAIRKAHHLHPEAIIAELYKTVLGFTSGTKQNDDLTAVVIKRVNSASPTPESH